MTLHPESQEFFPEPDQLHERFTEEELPVVTLQKNDWGTVSLQFADGSELLSLLLLRARFEDYGKAPKDMNLLPELYPQTSHISVLDAQLMSHRVQRTKAAFLFESKDKTDDRSAVSDAQELTKLAENYHFLDEVDGLDISIPEKVKMKKDFRTRSLLNDLNQYLAAIEYEDVWLKVHPSPQRTTTYAAQLKGFVLNTDHNSTMIEPLVAGISGTVGLLPPNVLIDPYVNVRVKD